jgi:hypothetical protein
MAQLPVLLRPKYLLRRKALRSGLFGPSRLWRSVAFVIIFSNSLRRFFGKTPERLGIRTIGKGHLITVAAAAPLNRRQAKRAGITKGAIAAAARADLEAAQRAS